MMSGNKMGEDIPKRGGERIQTFWVIVGAPLSVVPLLYFIAYFCQFFFFMDEWELIHKMNSLGYEKWLVEFYGGNFVPVFKLYWSALLFIGGGNYHILIWSGFILHGVVILLLGRLLQIWSFRLPVVIGSQLIVGLNYTHIEILSWSTQSSNLLSYIFYLGLLIVWSELYFSKRFPDLWDIVMIGFLSMLGALCFPRGVLNGFSVFVVWILMVIAKDVKWSLLWKPIVAALIPSVTVALTTAIWTYGHSDEFPQSAGRSGLVLTHFYYHLSLNPWYQQIQGLQISGSLSLVLIQLNILFIGLGLYLATTRQRWILLILIVFFVTNSFFLSLGRYHLPFSSAAAWRYQYGVLLVFAPIVMFVLERALSKIPFRRIRIVITVAILFWISSWVFNPWSTFLPAWSESRGTSVRNLITSDNLDPGNFDISSFDKVSNERAQELAELYQLH